MGVQIFLSSTFGDLRDERLEVIEVVRRLRRLERLDVDLITMEDFGFSDLPPIKECMARLQDAHVYLGLFGHRYGAIPKRGRLSYTEREYREAHRLGIPIFVLERAGRIESSSIESIPWKMKKLQELKTHARTHHVVYKFDDRQELGKVLSQYLPLEIRKRFPASTWGDRVDEELVPVFQLRGRAESFTVDRPVANTLDILAISAIGFLRDRGAIEAYLETGCRNRILVIRTGGRAQKLMSEQGEKRDLTSDLRQAKERAARLARYAETAGQSGRLEMRCLDWVPSTNLFLFDVGRPSALGWAGTYTPDISTAARDKWVLRLTPERGGRVLDFYSKQFNRLWKRAGVVV